MKLPQLNHYRAGVPRSRAHGGFTLIEMLIVIGIILLLTAITVTVVAGLSARGEIRDAENTMQLMEQALSEWELGNTRQVTYGINANGGEPCDDVEERYEIDQTVEAGTTWTMEDDAVEEALRQTDILWSILSRTASSREILARINPDYLQELDPDNDPQNELEHLNGRIGYRILDPWGNPILAVMPGRRSNNDCDEDDYCDEDMVPPHSDLDHCPDDDGTIRTPFENHFGIAVNNRIFFVSAGPNGQFGGLFLMRSSGNLNDKHKREIARAADNIYSREIILEEGRPQP